MSSSQPGVDPRKSDGPRASFQRQAFSEIEIRRSNEESFARLIARVTEERLHSQRLEGTSSALSSSSASSSSASSGGPRSPPDGGGLPRRRPPPKIGDSLAAAHAQADSSLPGDRETSPSSLPTEIADPTLQRDLPLDTSQKIIFGSVDCIERFAGITNKLQAIAHFLENFPQHHMKFMLVQYLTMPAPALYEESLTEEV